MYIENSQSTRWCGATQARPKIFIQHTKMACLNFITADSDDGRAEAVKGPCAPRRKTKQSNLMGSSTIAQVPASTVGSTTAQRNGLYEDSDHTVVIAVMH